MAGVYCPICEADVEPAAKYCLSCGHDMNVQGPITSTGHDLNQLREVIRLRDDLSMAEKFDMIAKIEEGANPIHLGIAAPAEGEEVDISNAFTAGEVEISTSKSNIARDWGSSPAANAAVRAVVRGTNAWDLIQDGKLDLNEGLFRTAMDTGMEASTHIHDVASGEHEGIDPDAMRAIPVLKPPKRSFCPKCGSDIHANTMLQWRKWRDSSSEVVSMQLEASMETALIQVASHYINVMQAIQDERDDAFAKLDKTDTAKIEENFDSIADGNKDWKELMKDFYKNFHPKVEFVSKNAKREIGERVLGIDPKSGRQLSVRLGKFGPMAQIGVFDDDEKPLFASLNESQQLNKITFEEALDLFKLPLLIGHHDDIPIQVNNGRYGPYLKYGKLFVSIPKKPKKGPSAAQTLDKLKKSVMHNNFFIFNLL